MTKRGSKVFAKEMGQAHEKRPNSRQGKMDLHNNMWGREAGDQGKNERDRWIKNKCQQFGEEYPRKLVISLSDPRVN